MTHFYADYMLVPDYLWRWHNFKPKEIACKCAKGTGCDGSILIDDDALDKLQHFRALVGVPFSPNSAYRCVAHNKAVGGVESSMHRQGRAFDIPISAALTRDKIHAVAKSVGFTAFGDYNTFVHIDTGRARHWDYRK